MAGPRRLAAFQPAARRAELVQELAAHGDDAAQLGPMLDAIAARGFERAPSRVAGGVTEISFPLFGGAGEAIAAFAIPYIALYEQNVGLEEAQAALAEAAAALQRALG